MFKVTPRKRRRFCCVGWGSPEVEGGGSESVVRRENGGGRGGRDASGGGLPADMGNGREGNGEV